MGALTKVDTIDLWPPFFPGTIFEEETIEAWESNPRLDELLAYSGQVIIQCGRSEDDDYRFFTPEGEELPVELFGQTDAQRLTEAIDQYGDSLVAICDAYGSKIDLFVSPTALSDRDLADRFASLINGELDYQRYPYRILSSKQLEERIGECIWNRHAVSVLAQRLTGVSVTSFEQPLNEPLLSGIERFMISQGYNFWKSIGCWWHMIEESELALSVEELLAQSSRQWVSAILSDKELAELRQRQAAKQEEEAARAVEEARATAAFFSLEDGDSDDEESSLYLNRPQWVWALVGNIVQERVTGQDHHIEKGTKHFKPGTKVYCLRSHWGDGYEQIPVIGWNRDRILIEVVMRRCHIERFRLQRVYKPAVIELMYQYYLPPEAINNKKRFEGWDNSDDDRRHIEDMVDWLNLSDEERDALHILTNFETFEFGFQSQECPNADFRLSLRWVERKIANGSTRGFTPQAEHELHCTFTDSANKSSDLLLELRRSLLYWSGEEHEQSFGRGLGFARAHLLKEQYFAEPSYWNAEYTWSLKASGHLGTFSSRGENCSPPELRDLIRLFQAHGIPVGQEALRLISPQR